MVSLMYWYFDYIPISLEQTVCLWHAFNKSITFMVYSCHKFCNSIPNKLFIFCKTKIIKKNQYLGTMKTYVYFPFKESHLLNYFLFYTLLKARTKSLHTLICRDEKVNNIFLRQKSHLPIHQLTFWQNGNLGRSSQGFVHKSTVLWQRALNFRKLPSPLRVNCFRFHKMWDFY